MIYKHKVKQFVNDLEMEESVKEVIMSSFLKERKDRDVYKLAASRIAIDLLTEAWKDLITYKENEINIKEKEQVGI